MTSLLDTHCHIDAYPDSRAVLRAATAADVTVVAVTEDPGTYRRFKTRLGRVEGVSVALGLHPASKSSAAPGQLQRFFRMLPQAEWIGEIGLDYSSNTDMRTRRAQYSTLAAIVDHDLARSKPMTLHSRGAAADVISVLEGSSCRAVLHWFTGTAKQAERAVEAGLWFSINSAMLRAKSGMRVFRAVPIDRILLETDGPFCTHRGRPSEPADLREIVDDLAGLLGMSSDLAIRQIASNTAEFINGHQRKQLTT
jgi:TatD DNase family protein